MSTEQIAVILGVWKGYRIGAVGRFEAGIKGPTAQVCIELLPEPDRPMVCNGCSQMVAQVYETTQRWVRVLDERL